MALSEQKRQQKIQRKKAKEKKRALAERHSRDLATGPAAVASAPILDAFALDGLWDSGIGHVLLSRRLPDGKVAVGMFLVDRYCLGVKDAMWRILSLDDYRRELLGRISRAGKLIEISPEFARKIVEGAVRYAGDLGLPPHRDYHKAGRIFGSLDASASDENIEFGQDGRPLFVPGPNDSSLRIAHVIATLRASCGDGNSNYVLMV